MPWGISAPTLKGANVTARAAPYALATPLKRDFSVPSFRNFPLKSTKKPLPWNWNPRARESQLKSTPFLSWWLSVIMPRGNWRPPSENRALETRALELEALTRGRDPYGHSVTYSTWNNRKKGIVRETSPLKGTFRRKCLRFSEYSHSATSQWMFSPCRCNPWLPSCFCLLWILIRSCTIAYSNPASMIFVFLKNFRCNYIISSFRIDKMKEPLWLAKTA